MASDAYRPLGKPSLVCAPTARSSSYLSCLRTRRTLFLASVLLECASLQDGRTEKNSDVRDHLPLVSEISEFTAWDNHQSTKGSCETSRLHLVPTYDFRSCVHLRNLASPHGLGLFKKHAFVFHCFPTLVSYPPSSNLFRLSLQLTFCLSRTDKPAGRE